MISAKKKMLCENIINNNKCQYDNKCMYAHSLDEQQIDPIRIQIYNLIDLANDCLENEIEDGLVELNFIENKDIFNNMIKLTRVCMHCEKKKCVGGYNCRYGSVSNEYCICYSDLMTGYCKRKDCKYHHLTRKGLVPYVQQKKQHDIQVRENIKKIFMEERNKIKENGIEGILLTPEFIEKNFNTNEDDDTSDDNDDELEEMFNYLNS